MFDVIARFIDNVSHLDGDSMLASAEHDHAIYFVYINLWRNDVDQSVGELAGQMSEVHDGTLGQTLRREK